MTVRKRQSDMTSGPLLSQLLAFALPIMAMNILQLLFNAADMVVVGRFAGSQALAAVGATGPLINLIINLFIGLSVGTSVVVARDYGAKAVEDIRQGVHTSITISVIGGFLVAVIGVVFCRPLLNLMGTPADIIDLSTVYMRIYFLGVPATMIYNFGAAILRATGDSTRPMYFLSAAGVVNVLLNLLFVIALNAGVSGVAWATVISQYLSLTLIMLNLLRNTGPLRFSLRRLRIDWDKLKEIAYIGIPAGLQNSLFSISHVAIQSAVNSFGSTVVAANTAAGNVEGFVGTIMNAYYNAVLAFAGQNMGAKKYDRIDHLAKVTAILVLATSLIVCTAILVFGPYLLGIYTSDPEVISIGMLRSRVTMTTYFMCGIMMVFPGLTRAMGFAILPTVCALAGNSVLRLAWLATVFRWYPSLLTVYLCFPVTWAVAGAGQVAIFFYARARIRAQTAEVDLAV